MESALICKETQHTHTHTLSDALAITRFSYIRNQIIRNAHVESQKIKKLLELHYMTIFSNKKLFHTYQSTKTMNFYTLNRI